MLRHKTRPFFKAGSYSPHAIIGCESIQVTASKRLTPNWATLPDFATVIAANLDHFSLMQWQDDPAASKIHELLRRWMAELPKHNVKDLAPPPQLDPLQELRTALGFKEPEQPWVVAPIESIEDVTNSPYALGNVVSRTTWGRHTDLVKAAEAIIGPNNPAPDIIRSNATWEDLRGAGLHADDVALWISFAESLSAIGVKLDALPNPVPKFSNITTETWAEYRVYKEALRSLVFADSPARFFVVVGVKTVFGAVFDTVITGRRQDTTGSDSTAADLNRRGMVIAYLLEEFTPYRR